MHGPVTLLLLLLLAAVHGAPPSQLSKPISRFAFGSCNNQDEPQGIWNAVLRYNPDLWLWLGDIVYADRRIVPFFRVPSPIPVMAEIYNKQKAGENYQRLLQKSPVIGVYDDHDYGVNNGGIEYNDKEEARKLLLNFLDEPKGSPRWQHKGAYTSYVIGPKGQRVKFILLDTRYNREYPEDTADMLGSEQWAWLEDELRSSDAEVNFIGSSIQVIPHDKPFQEKWANFPRSRERLLSLLLQLPVRNPILLSGDVHYGELFTFPCTDSKGNTRVLYEMTSSGMTHACAMQYPGGLCDFILEHFMTSKYHTQFYPKLNFGTVEIDWSAQPFVIRLQVRDYNGTVQAEERITDAGADKVLAGTAECLSDWQSTTILMRWRLERWVFLILVGGLSGMLVLLGIAIAVLSGKRDAKKQKAQ